MMPEQRAGVATFGGKPVTLLGPELKAGDRAPNFKLVDKDLKLVRLNSLGHRVKVISVVTSLDTGICDEQTRKFNSELSKFGERVALLTVSADTPFAQGRFCSLAGITHKVASDYRDAKFGKKYGSLMKELRLLLRSVFVVGKDGKIKYAYYSKENGTHPDYEGALSAVKKELGS